MLLLIFAIAALIGLIMSVSKTLRFLRQEDTTLAKKWAIISVVIILGYMLLAWIYKKLRGNDTTITTGNIDIDSIGSSDWKEGDYVRVKLISQTELYAYMDVKSIPGGVSVSPPAPWKTDIISGWITTSQFNPPSDTPELANVVYTPSYKVTVLASNGVGKGTTYLVKKSSILSIKKTDVPVEG